MLAFRNSNPSALRSSWSLSPSWELSYEFQGNARSKRSNARPRMQIKKLGQATEIKWSSKGQVDGKKNVVLLNISTSRQGEFEAGYSVQMEKILGGSSFSLAVRDAIFANNPTPKVMARKCSDLYYFYYAL